MKFVASQLSAFMQQRGARRNVAHFMRFLIILLCMIITYSTLFHYIMNYEGQEHSWLTGLYWTLTVMSTLGFGDITFTSDLGRGFSIIVLLSGVIYLLVMLPFAFIQYVYSPWLEAQKKRSAPRTVPATVSDHLLVIGLSPISINLVQQLEKFGFYCVLLCPDIQSSMDLEDMNLHAAVGDYDDGQTYRNLRMSDAAALLAMDSDIRNTNIIFSAREVDPRVPVIARAVNDESIDILQLAGATRVFQFRKLLGQALAMRVIGCAGRSAELTGYGSLVIAETPITGSTLIGKTLRGSNLRSLVGINVVGIWERGKFQLPGPDTVLEENAVLVVAGTREQLTALDNILDENQKMQPGKVLVLGAGRVGFAAAQELKSRGIDVSVVDKAAPRPNQADMTYIRGDAADLSVLEQAGIREATSIIITTHDDDTNIYLTIYCRRLRPDVQIITRATLDRNVSILHGAGADIVLSLVSMMTNNIVNMLAPGKVFMLNEGLSLFRSSVTKTLAGKTLMGSGIRGETRCSVVALRGSDGTTIVNPDPKHIFTQDEELYLIGDQPAQDAFHKRFGVTNF